MDEKLIKDLESYGYKNIVDVKGKGLCALLPQLYTVGLVIGLTKYSYEYRYCYHPQDVMIILMTLKMWGASEVDIEGDPEDSFWIKRKGRIEYSNPKH